MTTESSWTRLRMGAIYPQSSAQATVIGVDGVELPDDSNVCYACSTNKEMNDITAEIFKRHIDTTYPPVYSEDLPPTHILVIEASLRRKKKSVSQAIHGVVVTKLGDD